MGYRTLNFRDGGRKKAMDDYDFGDMVEYALIITGIAIITIIALAFFGPWIETNFGPAMESLVGRPEFDENIDSEKIILPQGGEILLGSTGFPAIMDEVLYSQVPEASWRGGKLGLYPRKYILVGEVTSLKMPEGCEKIRAFTSFPSPNMILITVDGEGVAVEIPSESELSVVLWCDK